MCKEAGLEGDKAILITLVSKVSQEALPFEETVIGFGRVNELCHAMIKKASFVAARAGVPVQVVKDDSRESSTAPLKPTGNGNSFVKHGITPAASKAGVDGDRRSWRTELPWKHPNVLKVLADAAGRMVGLKSPNVRTQAVFQRR